MVLTSSLAAVAVYGLYMERAHGSAPIPEKKHDYSVSNCVLLDVLRESRFGHPQEVKHMAPYCIL